MAIQDARKANLVQKPGTPLCKAAHSFRACLQKEQMLSRTAETHSMLLPQEGSPEEAGSRAVLSRLPAVRCCTLTPVPDAGLRSHTW